MGLSKGLSKGITLCLLQEYSPRKQQHSLESLAIPPVCLTYSQADSDFAALKLALPSEPSCIKVSIPHIAMNTNQVGILIEAFGSGGVQ